MTSLFLLSVIVTTIAVPTLAARRAKGSGLQKALLLWVLLVGVYGVGLTFIPEP